MTAIFTDNKALCNEVTERVVQHFVHCIETHGRHVPYLKFLQTLVKAEGEYIKKCQDMVMAEVIWHVTWGGGIETHGRQVPYLKFLQTVVKAEGEYIKKCQDMVMAEVQ